MRALPDPQRRLEIETWVARVRVGGVVFAVLEIGVFTTRFPPGYRTAAWALTGYSRTDLFNTTVYDGLYGATFGVDPTLNTVLTSAGTYKGPGVAGTAWR